MAYGFKGKKTEAGKKNGNGRFCTRVEAKTGSRKARRETDKKTCTGVEYDETCGCPDCKSFRAFIEAEAKRPRCPDCGETVESYFDPRHGDFDACGCDR